MLGKRESEWSGTRLIGPRARQALTLAQTPPPALTRCFFVSPTFPGDSVKQISRVNTALSIDSVLENW